MIGRVKYPDEKLAREVAVMNLIYHRTSIPVPHVIAWGRAADNALGLGPFLITSYMEGISLGDILATPEPDAARLMAEDISDQSIQKIYRQIARIQLELSKFDFDRNGCPSHGSQEIYEPGPMTVCLRPFTLKSHEILNVGGIDVFDMSLGPRGREDS